MRLLVFISCILISAFSIKNSTAISIETTQPGLMVVKGHYFGENLIINNPSDGGEFCVKEVVVNGDKTQNQLLSNAFEVDLGCHNLEYGTEIVIEISHNDECSPVIVNPEALEAESNFSFKKEKWNRREEKMNWNIVGKPGDENFEIQQYRWEKWVTITTHNTADSIAENYYENTLIPHNGRNLYRIKIVDKLGNTIYSSDIKCNSRNEEVFLVSSKIKEKIIFTAQTFYQIYTEQGVFIKSGFGLEVDVSNFEKGEYWINYDTNTESFKKK
jgi:hypothetical protein